MATAVLLVGWDRPNPGMEDKAFGYLTTEAMDYLKKLQGKFFERIEVVGLTPHGGDLNGFFLLFGDRAKLDELRRTDDFEAFVMKVGQFFTRLGVIPGVNWEGIQAVMARRQKS